LTPRSEVSLTGRARSGFAGRVRPDPGSSAPRAVRVLVVDDHRSVAESIGMAIDMQPDLRCVGIAGTVAEALTMTVGRGPDVVLTDVELPDGDGVENARRLIRLNPSLRVLVLTAHADIEVMARAASAGVAGFLPKETSISAVLTALRRAAEGEMTVGGSVLSALLDRAQASRSAAPPSVGVTDRELDVLRCLSQGLDPRSIARQLGISIHTCRGHVKRLLAKLDAHSQLEAVVKASQLGLLPDLGPV